jgi:hypothetical protein
MLTDLWRDGDDELLKYAKMTCRHLTSVVGTRFFQLTMSTVLPCYTVHKLLSSLIVFVFCFRLDCQAEFQELPFLFCCQPALHFVYSFTLLLPVFPGYAFEKQKCVQCILQNSNGKGIPTFPIPILFALCPSSTLPFNSKFINCPQKLIPLGVRNLATLFLISSFDSKVHHRVNGN